MRVFTDLGGRRRGLTGWVGSAAALAAVLALAAAAPAATFSDEAVEAAIRRGVKYLWSQQQKNGGWKTIHCGSRKPYHVGPTAICAYALLESGVKLSDKRMARAMAYLSKTKSDATYCLAFRALACAVASRQDPRYRRLLRNDVSMLIRSIDRVGGYTYTSRGSPPRRADYSGSAGGPDQSNAQYALLGVWAGRRMDLEVPRGYWQQSLRYWTRFQQRDGGWGYSVKAKKNSYMAMTLAGLASVFVCYDNLYGAQFLACRGNARLPAAEKGLAWVEKRFGEIAREKSYFYYTLYGVERVALASGYKYFGRNDWYKRGATELIGRQEKDGSWTKGSGGHSGGPASTTSYALLFLLRGRRPVLFNRLEYDGDWNNRPRALANLTRWFSRQFERDVHWQIINLKTPVADWHDAPILCLTGSKAPKLSDADLAKIRTFVHQGGTIFSIAECNGKAFTDGIREVYRKLFGTYGLKELAPGHAIYSAYNDLKPGKPTFWEVSNGARPLAVHTDDDVAMPWQGNRRLTDGYAYDAAANVVAYTNDKTALAGQLRFRGTTLWPTKWSGKARLTVKVARIRHAGNCDPEPLAYERFERLMGQRLGVKVDVAAPMPIGELAGSGARLAVMTGTGEFTLSAADKKALKAWVEQDGRYLLIDCAGGARAFREAAEAMLYELFGRRSLRQMSTDAPLYQLKGFEIKRAYYRRRTKEVLGKTTEPSLRTVMVGRRAGVLFSREDITAGLVGYPSYTVYGYRPETAFALLRNAVLLAAGRPLTPPRSSGPSGESGGKAWKMRVSASAESGKAKLALDGDKRTKWSTGRPMKTSDWFAIDLGAERKIKRIVLDSGEAKKDYPRGWKTYISKDGKDWGRSMHRGDGKKNPVWITFDKPVTTRHIKITLTRKHDKNHWTIADLRVYEEK